MTARIVFLMILLLAAPSFGEPATQTTRSRVVLVPSLWEGSYRPISAQRIDQLLNEELGGPMSGVAFSVGRPKTETEKDEMMKMAREGGVRYLIVPTLECRRSIEPLVKERAMKDRYGKPAPETNSFSIAGVGTLTIHDLTTGEKTQTSILLLESHIVEQRPGTQAFVLQEQNLAERLVRSFGQDTLRRLKY